jgi:hypothetical protein
MELEDRWASASFVNFLLHGRSMELSNGITGAAERTGQLPCLSRKPLITDKPWDCYHLESLLPLKETYRENTEFGFLLRHYWIPATALTFRQSSRTTFPDGRVEQCDSEIERKMARCRSNECLWREKTRRDTGTGSICRSGPEGASHKLYLSPFPEAPATSEMLCSYDCYEQTFHSAKPILFAPPTAEQKTEARRQALYSLPMLCPPGPVPIGFSWYGKVGDDYMNFRLEAEERLGETSVLVIRREGRYTVWLGGCPYFRPTKMGLPPSELDGEQKTIPVVVERQGITLFAWNRGAVLEDRYIDRVIEAEGNLATVVGTTNQVVTRLIRSCPENLAQSVPSPVEREAQRKEASSPGGRGQERKEEVVPSPAGRG